MDSLHTASAPSEPASEPAPRIRVLYVNQTEIRDPSNDESPQPKYWTHSRVLRWNIASALVVLSVAGVSFLNSSETPVIKSKTLPDYARYHWAGFYRISSLPVIAQVARR
jgi:hypothetical protein